MSIPVCDSLHKGFLPNPLQYRKPADAGVDDARLEAALQVVAAEVTAARLPGAVVAVVRNGAVVAHRAMGWAQFNPEPERRPMAPDTIFDLASLTKVMATLPSVLYLLERGAFRLDDRVADFFPSFAGEGKAEVRIRHLLTHTAGLAPWLPLEQEPAPRPELIERILTAPLQESPPGRTVIYSDLGFILLGELVAKVSGQPLDRFAKEHIFFPLHLPEAGFNPPAHWRDRCAATEYREGLGRHQVGEVHDERSTVLGGVAGHAGLFATAAEVAAYGQMWLQGGLAGGHQILSPATIAAATCDLTRYSTDSRGLGWIVLRQGAECMSCGDLFMPGAFGHTGFTGTSLWLDPARQLAVALLTNNVHFGRSDVAIRLRPRFHNAVAAAVL
ncbi:MAG TPA: serine hydrolase domain-containing protein [Symbiobacteriaceae bacterium]|nr:serine hydrolase domain-containing protein [Symbiobacteriaceae bacterium]